VNNSLDYFSFNEADDAGVLTGAPDVI